MKRLICLIFCLALIAGMVSCSAPAPTASPNGTNNQATNSEEKTQGSSTADKTTEEGFEALGVWEERELSLPAVADPTLSEVSLPIDTLTLHTTPINVDITSLKSLLSQNSFIKDNYILGEEWNEYAEEVSENSFNHQYEYKVSGQFKEGYVQETDTYFGDFYITLYYNPLLYTNQYRIEVYFKCAALSASTQLNHLAVLKSVLDESLAEYLVFGKDADGLKEAGSVYQSSCNDFELSETISNEIATYTLARTMEDYYYQDYNNISYSFGVTKLNTPEPPRYVVYNGDYESIYKNFPKKVESVISSQAGVSDPFTNAFIDLSYDIANNNSFEDYRFPDVLYQFRQFKCDDGYEIYEATFNAETFDLSYSVSTKGGEICHASYYSGALSGKVLGGTAEDCFNTLSRILALLTNENIAYTAPAFSDLVLDENGHSENIESTVTIDGLEGELILEFHFSQEEDGCSGNYNMWIRT